MAFKKIKTFVEENKLDPSKAYDVCVNSKQPSFAAVNVVPNICGTCSDEVDADSHHKHEILNQEMVTEEEVVAPSVVVEEEVVVPEDEDDDVIAPLPENFKAEEKVVVAPVVVADEEEAKPTPKASKKKSAKAE